MTTFVRFALMCAKCSVTVKQHFKISLDRNFIWGLVVAASYWQISLDRYKKYKKYNYIIFYMDERISFLQHILT